MKKLDLRGIRKVVFNDYSEYETGKSNNGGCYAFWTSYIRESDGNFIRKFGTSASDDFSFCPICGCFSSCNCDIDEDYLKVSEKELINEILKFREDENNFIEYYNIDNKVINDRL